MSDSPPLLVLMGPTASGKSALALEAARHLDGEIISVDSMQLYRGLEIGTAQPTQEEQRAVPHHLVGEFDFHTRIDVFQFCRLAERAIEEIRSRNRLPILAGGTGFYLKALLYGIDDLPADRQLRTELDEQYDSEAGEILLQDRMHALDPAALQRWGKCRRRLIRALEVRLLTGKSILELQQNPGDTLRDAVRAWKLEIPPELLAKRIARRAEAMLDAGWIDEARAAIADGLLDTPTAHQAIGYRLIAEHLAGHLTENQLLERIVTATRQFARRQRTWFRHQHPEARPLRCPAGAPPSWEALMESPENPPLP